MTPWLVALAMFGAPTAALPSAPFRSAVVIGVNAPFDARQPVLRYADDDAARYWEMFAPVVDHLELLTVLDDESQSLFVAAAAQARTPDSATLQEALARSAQAAAVARAEGRRTELYFVYVGHGRVRGGEGEVRLAGGVLGRTELTARVLASRAHDRTHVIIDACNAYHLVNARGDDAVSRGAAVTTSFDDAFEQFVDAQSVERFPTVGVVLSTSGPGATHEWSLYRGGIFSHEVRSAFAGAADTNGDDRLDYVELEAFVAAANLSVPNVESKPKVYVRAPRIDRAASLFELSPQLAALELPAALEGRFYLEDDRGLRYAELHKADGFSVSLRLLPRATYALLTAQGRPVLRMDAPVGVVRLALPLVEGEALAIARGGEAPPGLFAEPFGPRFVEGFRARELLTARPEPAEGLTLDLEPPRYRRIAAWSAAGVAVLAGAASVWQAREADAAYVRYRGTSDRDARDAFGQEVQGHRGRALGLGVTAGAVAAGAVALLIWELVDP